MNAQSARLVTRVLGAACAGLGLIAFAQFLGMGRGYHWEAGEGEPAPLPNVATIENETAFLQPSSQYDEIKVHPLFNEDRKPTPIEAPDTAVASDVPQVPLNATLTGVIITPEVKIAMLKDNTKGEPVMLHIGMPLPGDQAVWVVTDIQPRRILLKSGSDESGELSLEVSTSTPPAPTPRVNPPLAMPAPVPNPGGTPGAPATSVVPPPPPSAAEQQAATPPGDRAAELQKRIEERRREMREQAERQRQQQMQQDKQSE